jgi:hypothetical protein
MAGMPVDYLLGTMTITEGGLWGSLTGTSVDTIAMFVILGGFISAGQAGTGFMAFATQLAGRLRAGAAKVAILSSAFYGSISGVAAANTATTGMITIPAMKRLGYPPAAGRGDRGRGLDRRADPAAGDGGGHLRHGRAGAGALHRDHGGGAAAGDPVLHGGLVRGAYLCAAGESGPPPARNPLPGWAAVARSVPFFLLPFSS